MGSGHFQEVMMSNHVRLGPVIIRTGSKHLAFWGFPRLRCHGVSVWTWCNDMSLILISYHPASSLTWLWSVGIRRCKNLGFSAQKFSQRHHYLWLPFGFRIVIGVQDRMSV